jgi:hypothetical protein
LEAVYVYNCYYEECSKNQSKASSKGFLPQCNKQFSELERNARTKFSNLKFQTFQLENFSGCFFEKKKLFGGHVPALLFAQNKNFFKTFFFEREQCWSADLHKN